MKILYTWGKGKTGNTCHNIDKKYPSPPSVLISLNLDQLSMGPNHSAAIVNNECLMWGEVMGRKHTTLFKIVWKRRVVSVSCGFNHTLLLTSEYKIFSMGLNQVGQLGLENVVDSAVPLPIDTLMKHNIIKIRAGNNISGAITESGDLYCWGSSMFGQLGNGKINSKSNQFTPSTILPPLIPDHEKDDPIYKDLQYTNVCFGAQHTIAITTTGAIFSWGSNQYGQLGLNHLNTKLVPVPIGNVSPGSSKIVVDIASGNFHSALLTLEGDVYLWGSNQYGQLGQGDTIDLTVPRKVKGAAEHKKINRMALGNNHTILLTKEQDVYTFGSNEFYQLGHGSMGGKNKLYFPTLIQKPKLMASDIFASGDCSAFFILDDSPVHLNLLGGGSGLGNDHSLTTSNKHLSIFVGTWNCNAKRTQNLAQWIHSNSFSPDVIVLGLQEIVNMKAGAIVKATAADKQNNKENAYHPWKNDIEQTLTLSNSRYVKVMNKVLVGLMILVYIKEEHSPYLSEISGAIVPCGMMGKIGNKGGLGVRFTLYKTGICFVNSHLAAGPSHEKMERRNQDYKKIQMMTFENHLSILDHECLIWFGDLNYRIDLPYSETKVLVEQKNWSKLQSHDQLNNERKAGKAFIGFKEEPLNFAPTYKYDIGTNQFDTSEKNRTPSWCDRIIYRGESLKQVNYQRHELMESDHRPVSGLFLLEMKEPIHGESRSGGWSKIKKDAQRSYADSPDSFFSSKQSIGSAANGSSNHSNLDLKSSTSSTSSIQFSSYSFDSVDNNGNSTSSSGVISSTNTPVKRNLPNLPAPPLPPKSNALKKNLLLHHHNQNNLHLHHYNHNQLGSSNGSGNGFVIGSMPTFSPHFMYSNSPTTSDSANSVGNGNGNSNGLDLNNSNNSITSASNISNNNNNNNQHQQHNSHQQDNSPMIKSLLIDNVPSRKLSFSAEDIHSSIKILSNHRKIKLHLGNGNNNGNSNNGNGSSDFNNNSSLIIKKESNLDINKQHQHQQQDDELITFSPSESPMLESVNNSNGNSLTTTNPSSLLSTAINSMESTPIESNTPLFSLSDDENDSHQQHQQKQKQRNNSVTIVEDKNFTNDNEEFGGDGEQEDDDEEDDDIIIIKEIAQKTIVDNNGKRKTILLNTFDSIDSLGGSEAIDIAKDIIDHHHDHFQDDHHIDDEDDEDFIDSESDSETGNVCSSMPNIRTNSNGVGIKHITSDCHLEDSDDGFEYHHHSYYNGGNENKNLGNDCISSSISQSNQSTSTTSTTTNKRSIENSDNSVNSGGSKEEQEVENNNNNNDSDQEDEKAASGIIGTIDDLKRIIACVKSKNGDSISSILSSDSEREREQLQQQHHEEEDISSNGIFYIEPFTIVDQYTDNTNNRKSATITTTTTTTTTTSPSPSISPSVTTPRSNKLLESIRNDLSSSSNSSTSGASSPSPSSPRVLFNPIFDKTFFDQTHTRPVNSNIVIAKQRSSPPVFTPIGAIDFKLNLNSNNNSHNNNSNNNNNNNSDNNNNIC